VEKLAIGLAGVSELLAALSHSRPGSSSATTAAIQNSVPRPTCSLDVALLAFGCLQLSRNVSDKFISHVMKTVKLLQENGFENSPRFLQ
jgi:hypothetical protein